MAEPAAFRQQPDGRGHPGCFLDSAGVRNLGADVRTSVRAWWVAAVTMAALVAAAGFRSSTGALLEPLEHEFGWSRATTSGAVSLNLVIYGLTAPFAAALMERFGVRRVVAVALAWSSLRGRADPGDDLRLAALVPLGSARSGWAPARWRWCSGRSSPTAGSCGTAAWSPACSRRRAPPAS